MVGEQVELTRLVYSRLHVDFAFVVDVVVAHLLLGNHLVDSGLLLLLRRLAVGRDDPFGGGFLLFGFVVDGAVGLIA